MQVQTPQRGRRCSETGGKAARVTGGRWRTAGSVRRERISMQWLWRPGYRRWRWRSSRQAGTHNNQTLPQKLRCLVLVRDIRVSRSGGIRPLCIATEHNDELHKTLHSTKAGPQSCRITQEHSWNLKMPHTRTCMISYLIQ